MTRAFHPVCGKHGLDIVPQRLVDNRRLFSGIGIAFVRYLAAASDHVLAAIGAQRRTCDEPCLIGDEENHASCDFLRLAEPAHWNER